LVESGPFGCAQDMRWLGGEGKENQRAKCWGKVIFARGSSGRLRSRLVGTGGISMDVSRGRWGAGICARVTGGRDRQRKPEDEPGDLLSEKPDFLCRFPAISGVHLRTGRTSMRQRRHNRALHPIGNKSSNMLALGWGIWYIAVFGGFSGVGMIRKTVF